MKNLLTVLALIIASGFATQAQENNVVSVDDTKTYTETLDFAPNSVFVEVGGNGTQYSVNYDKIWVAVNKIKLSTQIGIGMSSAIMQGDCDPIIPVKLNLLVGQNRHFFETGIGAMAAFGFEETTASTSSESANGTHIWQVQVPREYASVYVSAHVGYRFQSPDGGLFLKTSLSPTMAAYTKTTKANPTLAGSIGIGYTFKNNTSQIPVMRYY